MDKDMKKKAKMEMLKELKKMMMDEMNGDVKESLESVKVVSDSEEGLEEGLSKAQQILQKRKEMEESKDYDMMDASEEEMMKKLMEMGMDEEDEEEDYDDEQGEVPGEQDTGPDEYAMGGYKKKKKKYRCGGYKK